MNSASALSNVVEDQKFWLSLEMSGLLASFALYSDREGEPDSLVAHEFLPTGHRQLESFLPTLDRSLNSLGLQPGGLTGCLVTRGPGSFTGLRTAFASVKGLLMGCPAVLETYDTAECRALECDVSSTLPIGSRLHVLSELSIRKVMRTSFEVIENHRLRPLGIELVIEGWAPDPTQPVLAATAEALERWDLRTGIVQPISAETLVRVRDRAQMKTKSCEPRDQWLAAPEYYASSFTSSSA